MADSLFAVVFPTTCALCGQELAHAGGVDICRNCWTGLEPWLGAACEGCGLPLASDRALDSATPLCAQCRAKEFDFDLARSYGLYADRLRGAILHLKFHARERLGKKLGELLAVAWSASGCFRGLERPILVPVPLHASRERERGFNQAELLARGLSRKLRKMSAGAEPRVEAGCLRRTLPTPPQTGLSFHARQENVRGVFAVSCPERVRGRAVIVVDDVMTTGATLSACAAALKGAGALRVLGLTLARATPRFPGISTSVPPEGVGPVDEFDGKWT